MFVDLMAAEGVQFVVNAHVGVHVAIKDIQQVCAHQMYAYVNAICVDLMAAEGVQFVVNAHVGVNVAIKDIQQVCGDVVMRQP